MSVVPSISHPSNGYFTTNKEKVLHMYFTFTMNGGKRKTK